MDIANEDMIYEISTHLDLRALQKLCSTHPDFAQLCQRARFKQLIQTKYQQIVKVIDQASELLDQNRATEYTIPSGPGTSHKLRFENNRSDYSITETFLGSFEQDAILRKLFPSQVMTLKINNYLLMAYSSSVARLNVKDLTIKEIQKVLYYLVTNNLLDPSKIDIKPKGPYDAIYPLL